MPLQWTGRRRFSPFTHLHTRFHAGSPYPAFFLVCLGGKGKWLLAPLLLSQMEIGILSLSALFPGRLLAFVLYLNEKACFLFPYKRPHHGSPAHT